LEGVLRPSRAFRKRSRRSPARSLKSPRPETHHARAQGGSEQNRQGRKCRRKGLKRLNPRPEMVWPRKASTPKIWYGIHRGWRMRGSGSQAARTGKQAAAVLVRPIRANSCSNPLKTLKTARARPCNKLASMRGRRPVRLAPTPRFLGSGLDLKGPAATESAHPPARRAGQAPRAALEAGFFDQRLASAATSALKGSESNFRGSKPSPTHSRISAWRS